MTSNQGSGAAPVISVQVILQPASGAAIRGDVPITSANIREFAPAADVAEAARRAFAALGFEVGPVVGISFSATAPASRFESVFGVGLVERDGHVTASGVEDPQGLLLPLSALPPEARAGVTAVTLTPPAELFGGWP